MGQRAGGAGGMERHGNPAACRSAA
jgi:hypothetical protein